MLIGVEAGDKSGAGVVVRVGLEFVGLVDEIVGTKEGIDGMMEGVCVVAMDGAADRNILVGVIVVTQSGVLF
jgi:hypothetical protein